MAKKKKTFKEYLERGGDMYLQPRILFEILDKLDLMLKELKNKK